MNTHRVKPADLAPGIYWYMVPGKPAEICERRDAEKHVRFLNGSHQTWIRDGESFVGPVLPPQAETIA